jgi:propionyl-CoA synthetase
MSYAAFYQQSIQNPESFWDDQAKLIDWHKPYQQVLDHSQPPFAKWFVGGETNLCYNAVDRWVATQPDKAALIAISTETNTEKVYSFAELHQEVQRMAAIMLSLGVQRGDRVLIYMPMIAEAAFAMLACARIGAVHSVVFGGFASKSLATRIDDAKPVLVVSADAGMRGGKAVPYKPLLNDAIELAEHKPAHVLIVNRGLDAMTLVAGRDVDYAALRAQHMQTPVPVTWLESNEMSYVLYHPARLANQKACSAMSVVMRWRWLRR